MSEEVILFRVIQASFEVLREGLVIFPLIFELSFLELSSFRENLLKFLHA